MSSRFLSGLFILHGFLCLPHIFAEEARLVLLHINDTHGQLTTPREGGNAMSRIARYVADQREQFPGEVLFLHGGDELSRGNALVRATLGASSFALFDAMGLDAFTAGNGDFYDGAPNLLRLAAGVRFPVLHANTAPADPSARWFPATTVVERNGVKIGIVGGGRTVHFGGPEPEIRARPFNDAVKPLLGALTNKADMVVALTHQGMAQDLLLARHYTGIDLVVGADSHTEIKTPLSFQHVANGATNTTWVVQAGEHGGHVGRLEILLERPEGAARWKVKSVAGGLERMHAGLPGDEKMDALVQAWQDGRMEGGPPRGPDP